MCLWPQGGSQACLVVFIFPHHVTFCIVILDSLGTLSPVWLMVYQVLLMCCLCVANVLLMCCLMVHQVFLHQDLRVVAQMLNSTHTHTHTHTGIRWHTAGIWEVVVKRALLYCQKRPTILSKETYYTVKRDLLYCQKRPIRLLYSFRLVLLLCQKRPTILSKETCFTVKRDL